MCLTWLAEVVEEWKNVFPGEVNAVMAKRKRSKRELMSG